MSLEEILVRHASPTLKGIKTSNLVNVKCPYFEKANSADLSRRLRQHGIELEVLRETESSHLVFIYQRQKLRELLQDEEIHIILTALGYRTASLEACISRMKERLLEEEFPHEIGLFLDYPVVDVIGFVENRGKNYQCCGYWKVYGDVTGSQELFQRYDQCGRECIEEYLRGASIEELIVR